MSSQGSVSLAGTVYTAYGHVLLSGQSGSFVAGGQVIADTVSVSGSAITQIDPGSQPVARTRVLGLVE